jgi:tryptophan-rich sensory protein
MTAIDTPKGRLSRRDWLVLAAILAISFTIAALGGWVTAPAIPTWYAGLAKPSFNPPDWIFGPVWTALYLMMSISAWLAWRAAPPAGKAGILLLYGVQLGVNLLWSILFFALHLPLLALIDCLALLGLIGAMVVSFRRQSSLAAWMLVPYGLWVSFACLLNAAIVQLN